MAVGVLNCLIAYTGLKCMDRQKGTELKRCVYAGGSGDPSRAGAVGAGEEPPYQGAEEDKQRRQFGVSPFYIQDQYKY